VVDAVPWEAGALTLEARNQFSVPSSRFSVFKVLLRTENRELRTAF
jgi:hypothetical protein